MLPSAVRVAAAAAAALASVMPGAHAGQPLTHEILTHDSLASAMMLGLVDNNTAFVLDKVEGNAAKLPNGKIVWGSLIDLTDGQVRGVDVETNAFCAAGMTMPNGTWAIVGGNQAVQYGNVAVTGSSNPYQSKDGRRAIRLLDIVGTPPSGYNWNDDGHLQMAGARWYPTVESIADGTLVIVGGSTSGGYINRNTPNVDPTFEAASGGSIQNLAAGGANPTYEYFPARSNVTGDGTYQGMQMSKFMTTTSGLNMYPHMYLMPSGRIFMNANVSNILWDHNANVETPLPDTPGGVIRVYPASAATAMKPLTPANDYTPTILFCGGMVLDDDDKWGNYTAPNVNMYQTATSTDCASITPEHADGTAVPNPKFETEDSMPVGRTMGQFVHLPTGQMLIVNGGENGTAGYGNTTWNMIEMGGQQVRLEGMASGPTLTPLLYDPDAPAGHRFTDKNFGKSQFARLYHSSAILAPDGSVLIAGSNPHNDVNLEMPLASDPQGFNTTYVVEKWYPDYYFAPRPEPQGLPSVLTYGGDSFNVTVGKEYMNKSSNALAASTKFMVIRPGFSTHAMNMGQRSLQLQSTYEVQNDGSVVYTVNPLPTNPNLITAGPGLLFVTIAGVPSQGKFISVGEDMSTIGPAPWTPKILSAPAVLPAARNASGGQFDDAPSQTFTGTGPTKGENKAGSVGSGSTSASSMSSGTKIGLGVGIGVGVAAVLAAALAGIMVYKKKHNSAGAKPAGYTYAADSALGAQSGDALAPPAASFAPYGAHPAGASSHSTFDSYSLHHMQPGGPTGSREALTAGMMGSH